MEFKKLAKFLHIKKDTQLRKDDILKQLMNFLYSNKNLHLKEDILNNFQIRNDFYCEGVLEIINETNYGFLRSSDCNYIYSTEDSYVSPYKIILFKFKTGDTITGKLKWTKKGEKYFILRSLLEVNGVFPYFIKYRYNFEHLTPLFPEEKLQLSEKNSTLSTRIIDLFSPIGKGLRGMIVSPPKTGKTLILKELANAIYANHPEVYLIFLLIDERPEEVTDIQRLVKGEVITSTFDKAAENHIRLTNIVLQKAKRMVECKQDVFLLLDSITKLTKSYNTIIPSYGKILSGGLDSNSLYEPKMFFGSARKIEEGGSLSILSTAMIETGSKIANKKIANKKIANKKINKILKLQIKGGSANPSPPLGSACGSAGIKTNNSMKSNQNSQLLQTRKLQKYEQIIKLKQLFSHLHNHTTFSILSSTIQIHSLVETAYQMNMSAIGITDSGNMMGSYYFLKYIDYFNHKISIQNEKLKKYGGKPRPYIKGVIGCELFISENSKNKNGTDIRYHQVLFAKNTIGYRQLLKLCSKSFINGDQQGYYSNYPIVGKDIIEKYKCNLIALTGDLHSEIPSTILNKGEIQAETIFQWWHKCFGKDFYVELLRHGLEVEKYINKILLKFATKYGVPYIPQNNNYYLEKKDYKSHQILLGIRKREKKDPPIVSSFDHQEFYFKSSYQMAMLFSDLPESFYNLNRLIETIKHYNICQKILLPKFDIPANFKFPNVSGQLKREEGENWYLRYLTYKGAKKIYGTLNPFLKKRLDFELATIKKTGYPGYFLLVKDLINQAKKLNIYVGPGRGSVAGSLVAYCLAITHIDPIQHNLLFERFLNPDRVTFPDIDMDFDAIGRDHLIKWIVNKYGTKNVSKIITYGYMGAKSSIRDTARVMGLSLDKADYLAKLTHNISLKKLLLYNRSQLYKQLNSNSFVCAMKLQKISKTNTLEGQVLNQAKIIEGSLRNTGVHACGIIITPTDITNHVPVVVSKDTKFLVTQFDQNIVEHTGLLKMDLLGLKTLTIIKNSICLINKIHNVNLDPNKFPLDDNKTYNLFKKGKTIAVFQYESVGMQKYLRQLRPDNFNDIIAMNALYRPGPLKYIPNFIERKHGKEAIVYDLPIMENILKSTYGITVYQEQVMLLAQKLANFGKGEADILRKAIGKKQKNILDKMKNQFILGSVNNGYPKKLIEKIWKDWEVFAYYAFNKSHSTCYAYIAFQTAYLKTHYPAEYMSEVLSNHMYDMKNLTLFLKECLNMGITILGPDLNASDSNFAVENRSIRFGMCAIKGIGEAVVENIIKERKTNGIYHSIFDFVKRVNLSVVNKKAMEILIHSGVFDSLHIHRAQFFYKENGLMTIDNLIQFGIQSQNLKKSLFNNIATLSYPSLPQCKPLSNQVKGSKAKEFLGIDINFSSPNTT